MSEDPTEKNNIDYEVINRLVNENEDLSEQEILQLYKNIQQGKTDEQVALLTGTVVGKADVLLKSALRKPKPEKTESQAQYIIEKIIASGGQSDVYLALRKDQTFTKTVAVKVIKFAIHDEKLAANLLNEIQILAALNHPNIVPILDAGFDQNQHPWLVLNYIDGVHINQYLHDNKLTEPAMLGLYVKVLQAVAYIHQKDILHLDIKPANILIEEVDNKPKPVIIDFGISLENHKSKNVEVDYATPAFASPEQLDINLKSDHRSDIYSLGKLLENLLSSIDNKQLIKPDLQAILNRCIAPQPDQRYQSVNSLLKDVKSYISGDPVSVRPLSWSQKLGKKYIKRPWINSLILALILSIFTLSGYLIHKKIKEQQESILQVKKNQYYWDIADNIERESGLIYARPSGNIEEDLNQLNTQYQSLRTALATENQTLQQTASFAVATAATSLGEFQEAQPYLIKANQADPENKEISYALAINHLQLYQAKLEALKKFSNSEFRKTHTQRLKKQHLEVAKPLLEHAQTKENAMINGMLIYLNGEAQDAIDKLNNIENEGIWPVQKWILTAQIHKELATQFKSKAEVESTVSHLESTIAILNKAKSFARSHPQIHTMLCQAQSELYAVQKLKPESFVVDECDALIQLLPNSQDATLTVANTYGHLGKTMQAAGIDPQPIIDLAENALLDEYPNNEAEHQLVLGQVNYVKGEWAFNANIAEGHEYYKKSIQHFKSTTEKLPENYFAQLTLAENLYSLANFTYETDPQSDQYFQQAIDTMLALQDHADATITLSTNLVRIVVDFAYQKFQLGQAPEEHFELANQVLNELKSHSPDNPYVLSSARYLYWTQADYLVYQNINPEPYLSDALVAFDADIKVRPSSLGLKYNKISAMLLGVSYFIDQNESQNDQLKSVDAALTTLQNQVSENVDLSALWGFYNNMLARQQILNDQSPSEALNLAKGFNHSCISSPIDSFACYTQWATYLEIKHQWDFINNEFDLQGWEADFSVIKQGLEKFPEHNLLKAQSAQLDLLFTDLYPMDTKQKQSKINHAKNLLEQALVDNPLLTGKFKPTLLEIEKRLSEL